MPAFVIIAITCAVAVGQSPSSAPLEQSVVRVILTFGSMLVSCMMARITVIACLDTSTIDGSQLSTVATDSAERYRARWEQWHLAVWLGMTAFLIFGIGWGTIVRTNWGLGSTILLDELVILIPLLLPWLVSWAFFYELEKPLAASPQHRLRQRWRFAIHHARQIFGLGLLPVLTVCLISDIARHVSPELIDQPIPARFFLAPMALLIVGYPLLLRRLWKTSPLPNGELRTTLEQFSQTCQIRIHELFVWHTGGNALNAAVTGVVPRLRYLFFTDRILDELPKDEVIAAMAHEFGHIHHRHLPLRMSALFFPVTSILVLNTTANWMAGTANLSTANPTVALVPSGILAFLTVLISVLYLWQVIGGYSRRLELQADEAGWRFLKRHLGCGNKAAEVYNSMLNRISTGHDRGGGWLHPSIDRRIENVRLTAIDEASSLRWNRVLNATGILLCVITVAAVTIMLAGG